MPIRIRRIQRAELIDAPIQDTAKTPKMREALLSIGFESDALERAHAQFANYKVEDTLVENEHGKKIILRVSYPDYAEDSLLKSLLSFGPEIEVTAPTPLAEKIRRMVLSQQELFCCFSEPEPLHKTLWLSPTSSIHPILVFDNPPGGNSHFAPDGGEPFLAFRENS